MRNIREVGMSSIGGVATEKVQSTALNLGFPSAYQSVYAAKGLRTQFFPEAPSVAPPFWAGDDLQSAYHIQKKSDADKMAGAKVRSTQTSRVRFASTPHGLGGLPEAQLAQRQFANPSNGAFVLNSARQDQATAPFHYADGMSGGVLRSAQGQAYGRARLVDRVRQLNAIQTAKQDFAGMPSMGVASPAATSAFSAAMPSAVSPSIELNLLLQQILDSLVGVGTDEGAKLDKFDLSTASRAFGLIFRMVPEANDDFVEDLLAKVDSILQLLNGVLDPETASAGLKATAAETALSLQVLFTKLRQYLVRMTAGAPVERLESVFNPLTGQQEQRRVLSQEQGQNLAKNERLALSKNLVSSLGFSKMLKYAADANDSGLLSAADRDRLFTSQQAQRFLEGDMGGYDDDDDDDGGESDFDESGRPREDTAHDDETGVSRSSRGFSTDNRSLFGNNSGEWFRRGGRPEEAFLGEEARLASAEEDARDMGVAVPFLRPRSAVLEGAPDVRGIFDRDTGSYGVEVRRPPPPSQTSSVAPSRARSAPRARSRASTLNLDEVGERSTATRSITSKGVKHYAKLPSRFNPEFPEPPAPQVKYRLAPTGSVRAVRKLKVAAEKPPAPPSMPKSRADLPTTRAGFIELSRKLVAEGGPRIVVYEGSAVGNIRRNFIKRLGL